MSPATMLAALALGFGVALARPRAALPPGNLELCTRWQEAHGAEKATLANHLGAINHLTKNQRLAEAQPGDTRSLYRTADLQRLCRTP